HHSAPQLGCFELSYGAGRPAALQLGCFEVSYGASHHSAPQLRCFHLTYSSLSQPPYFTIMTVISEFLATLWWPALPTVSTPAISMIMLRHIIMNSYPHFLIYFVDNMYLL